MNAKTIFEQINFLTSDHEPILMTHGNKKSFCQAQLAAEDAVKIAHEAGMRKVKVYVKGPGNGRESAIRSIHNAGVEVTEIFDKTPIPHNGCRPPKRRRV